MLELILCSMLTILPDFLCRRYVQGKRLGKEITFFSVWFELRYGIVACLMLTVFRVQPCLRISFASGGRQPWPGIFGSGKAPKSQRSRA